MKHKSNWTRVLLALIVVLAGRSANGQNSRTLTLKEAVELTLANSKTIKTNKLKIEEASAAVTESIEKRLPDAGISGSALFLPVNPGVDLKTGGNNSGTPPRVSEAIYGSANVSLPLYTGGRLKYGIESAKYLEQAVKLDADQDRSLVILNSINACINLYKAHQAITLVKENLKQSQQRVNDFTSLEKNGLLARNDLLKAELQASRSELDLLDAEGNYKIACVNMNLMMGLPEQTELIPDKTGLALPATVKTLEEYEQDALKGRKDMAAVSFRKKAAELGIKNVKGSAFPTLALTGGYIAVDIPKFLTVTNAMNVGIAMKYDLASLWKSKTKIRQAQLNVQQIALSESMLDDNIRLQVNQAYQNYLVSVKKIEVYEKSVEQATENFRITKNKFDNALATATELLDADAALLQAKLSVTNAKADSFLGWKRLLQASGQLDNQ